MFSFKEKYAMNNPFILYVAICLVSIITCWNDGKKLRTATSRKV